MYLLYNILSIRTLSICTHNSSSDRKTNNLTWAAIVFKLLNSNDITFLIV